MKVDCDKNATFILLVLQKYTYEMVYTHKLGVILAHVSKFSTSIDKALQTVTEMVKIFPEVMFNRKAVKDKILIENRKKVIQSAFNCVGYYLGNICPEIKQLLQLSQELSISLIEKNGKQQTLAKQDMIIKDIYSSHTNNRWAILISRFMQSLLFQFIPSQLSSYVVNMYLQSRFVQINACPLLNGYQSFIKLAVSLLHYGYFLKKPSTMDEYFQICLNCYMGVVEWPIVIANRSMFQLKEKYK